MGNEVFVFQYCYTQYKFEHMFQYEYGTCIYTKVGRINYRNRNYTTTWYSQSYLVSHSNKIVFTKLSTKVRKETLI